jgi:hypothetical protein
VVDDIWGLSLGSHLVAKVSEATPVSSGDKSRRPPTAIPDLDYEGRFTVLTKRLQSTIWPILIKGYV